MTTSLRQHPLRLLALLVLIAAATMAAIAPAIQAAQTGNEQVDTAVAWLTSQQIDNGGFAAFGGESDAGTTADVVYALAAAGVNPADVLSGAGNSPLDYLESSVSDFAANPGLAGKAVLALHASGRDPYNVAGTDLVAAIQDAVNPDSGLYGEGMVNHSYALLALVAVGADAHEASLTALTEAQIEDGAWSFTGDTTPGSGDTNTTAIAIQSLAASGSDQNIIEDGIAYILSMQDDTGAIAYDASEAPNIAGDANSTAVAIQALLAAGQDATSQIEALATFQNESGAFFWRADFADDSLLATAQAIPALLEVTLPLEPLAVESADEAQPAGANALDAALQPASPADDCVYFEITEHNACGSFLEYWTVKGGLMTFGYPLTEEFVDDDGRTVQYFERARFELHPEHAGTPYEVMLGRLGAEHIEHADQP